MINVTAFSRETRNAWADYLNNFNKPFDADRRWWDIEEASYAFFILCSSNDPSLFPEGKSHSLFVLRKMIQDAANRERDAVENLKGALG